GETVSLLSAGTHFTRLSATTIRGPIQTLCVLGVNQRVIVNDDMAHTHLVRDKQLTAGEVRVELRRARPVTDAGYVARMVEGPPGTGKSSLARALAAAFEADLMAVTAHEDWSTFEVIGRQELRVRDNGAEEIVAVNGHFTEAAVRCAGQIPHNADDPSHPQAT